MSNDGTKGYTVNSIHHALKGGTLGLKEMPRLIKTAIKGKIWEGWVDIHTQQRYSQPDFETFVTTPILEGLGATTDQIKALCEKDREALDLIDQELTRKPGGQEGNTNNRFSQDDDTNNDNVMIRSPDTKASQGNSIEYTLRRLRKDHPELHEKVLANEMSPNAAAIEAGFRKRTVTVTLEVDAIARVIKKHLSLEQRITLAALIQQERN